MEEGERERERERGRGRGRGRERELERALCAYTLDPMFPKFCIVFDINRSDLATT